MINNRQEWRKLVRVWRLNLPFFVRNGSPTLNPINYTLKETKSGIIFGYWNGKFILEKDTLIWSIAIEYLPNIAQNGNKVCAL